jgi:hypothetical protein
MNTATFLTRRQMAALVREPRLRRGLPLSGVYAGDKRPPVHEVHVRTMEEVVPPSELLRAQKLLRELAELAETNAERARARAEDEEMQVGRRM